ncbi:SDR family NAD(P)-dependent oxidoreductase [Burkholderia pyrrocinia]|uniref:SDR family NAD(P)-dependent oxidoreductase n=1 Tax=Burkholderia pyrrocinia TaxID=60550 RepID=UPI0038B5253C
MNDNGFPQGAVLVFGGSGGIGQGVALEFARGGVPVAVGNLRKADVAERVAREIRDEGVAATTHCVDVTDLAQVDAALAAASDAHGRVHTVVWAAGPFVNQRHIVDMTHDDWRRAIEVETIGFLVAAKVALPHFRASGGGSFVTLGPVGHLRWPDRDGLSVAHDCASASLAPGARSHFCNAFFNAFRVTRLTVTASCMRWRPSSLVQHVLRFRCAIRQIACPGLARRIRIRS